MPYRSSILLHSSNGSSSHHAYPRIAGQLERDSQNQSANGGATGVGRGNTRSHCGMCTPPRKIRAQLQEYKHTSLVFLVGKSWSFVLLEAGNEPRIGCRNALETAVL